MEWLGCELASGALLALSLAADATNPRWELRLPGYDCLENTLSFGRDGRGIAQVGVYFQLKSKAVTEVGICLV